jgi:hypothetical protein
MIDSGRNGHLLQQIFVVASAQQVQHLQTQLHLEHRQLHRGVPGQRSRHWRSVAAEDIIGAALLF